MTSFARTVLAAGLLALVCAGAAGLRAQSSELPAAETPERPRPISRGVAAALAAAMPKYNPPKPIVESEDESVDMRDIDKPRNKIIRLPAYVVREKKPPVFSEREIHTKKGLAALAKNRYLSRLDREFLNVFTLPLFGLSQDARALQTYAEDERLENMADLKESADDVGLVDPDNAKEIKAATRNTYGRQGFDYTYRKRN